MRCLGLSWQVALLIGAGLSWPVWEAALAQQHTALGARRVPRLLAAHHSPGEGGPVAALVPWC